MYALCGSHWATRISPFGLGGRDRAHSRFNRATLLVTSFLIGCMASAVVCLAVWHWRHPLFPLVRRSDLTARQSSHTTPTLRLGGLGIILGLCSAAAIDARTGNLLVPLIFAVLPIFVSGLLEDFGLSQSPAMRLAMAGSSGVLAIWILDVVLPHIGIPILDPILSLYPASVAFTLFATTGIVHAFNLVDGLNGFAGFNALVVLAALIALAGLADAPELLLPAAALGGAVLGFLLLNFPSGRLFLGDAGAYTIGFFLAWFAVMVVASDRELTPWAVLLVFFWPVADTFLAIARRLSKGGRTARADRMHAHHVMMRGIQILLLGRQDRNLANPLASAFLLPLVLPPPLTALLVWNEPLWAAIATGLYAVIFVAIYLGGISAMRRARKRLPRRVSTVSGVMASAGDD